MYDGLIVAQRHFDARAARAFGTLILTVMRDTHSTLEFPKRIRVLLPHAKLFLDPQE